MDKLFILYFTIKLVVNFVLWVKIVFKDNIDPFLIYNKKCDEFLIEDLNDNRLKIYKFILIFLLYPSIIMAWGMKLLCYILFDRKQKN